MPCLSGLYAITHTPLMPDLTSLLIKVEQSLRGGAKIVQYRDKINSYQQQLAQATALRSLCANYQAIFIINDSIQLALDSGANGVHLGQTDGSAIVARQQLGSQAVVGVTCHGSLALAQQAESQGADYVAFGACFASKSKPEAKTIDIDLIRQARAKLACPIVAIGGISVDNASKVISAGAHMVAVINALYAQPDIETTAQQFKSLF